jgi:hypothetical protein
MPGDRLGAAQHEGRLFAQASAVDAQLDGRIEHGEQPVEVALSRGTEERVDDRALTQEVAGGFGGAPHSTAGAAGELLGSGLGSIQ